MVTTCERAQGQTLPPTVEALRKRGRKESMEGRPKRANALLP